MAKGNNIVLGLVVGSFVILFLVFFAIGIIRMSSDRTGWSGFGDKVAIVEIQGTIDRCEEIVDDLRRYADDNSVKGIVVRINSPGGVVGAAQEIYAEVLRISTEERKPIVASMGSVAASGGYYIACGADCIYANPGTLTGSIGVIMQYPVMKDMLDKIGIQFETVTAGEVKDVGSPYQYPDDRDSVVLKRVIEDTHQQFVNVVSERRRMEPDEVVEVADGSLFTGLQAQRRGLVDSLGGLESAIAYLEELSDYGSGLKRIRPEAEEGFTIFDLFGKSATKIINFSDVGSPKLMYLYR